MMNSLNKHFLQYFFLFLFLFIGFNKVSSQNIDSTLGVYSEKYAQERLYFHYDKAAYFPGETVWFKAYILQDLYPSFQSKTLYIDWVDDKGNVLQHQVSPLVEGTAIGHFEVPEDFAGSTLHIKAYTRWMLNFDAAFLYSKDLIVLGGKKTTTATSKQSTTLQFFAEGGEAIAGILSKIAFKATDQLGRPQKIRGVIQDNLGATIDSFKSVHDGMGYLILIPKEGMSYSAQWKDENNTTYTTPLPLAKASGATMQLFVSGANRPFIINRSPSAAATLKQLHLVGTMHEQIVFKANINLATVAAVRGSIPTGQLPTGLLTITLFDDQWNAIAERITFVNNGEYAIKPNLQVQQWGMKKRARNEMELSLPDSIVANLSVSVTDAGIEKDTSENIFTRLLLTSEIKGIVNNPSFYFSDNSDAGSQLLDLVMLTNGWRRFKWEEVVAGTFPKITFPKDTAYLALSGKVYGYRPGEAADGGALVLIVKQKDSSSQMMLEPINPDGSFKNPNFIFFDTLHVYYQVQKSKGLRGAEVNFMSDRLPPLNFTKDKGRIINRPLPDTAGAYRHFLFSQEEGKMQDLMKVKTLQNVTVTGRKKSPLEVLDEKYAGGMFRGGDGYQFDLLSDPSSAIRTNVFEYLRAKVAGLQVSSSGGNVSLSWRGGAPQIFLDEIPVDVDMVTFIPVSDIAYIKVMRPPFFGGVGGGANGAIALYTRKGGDIQNTPGKGLSNNTIVGYTPNKEFYSPNYNSFDARHDQADVRTTLYWNPRLETTPLKSKVTFSFFNNDVSKSFRIVIEGVSRDGRLIHYEEVLE